MNPSSLPPHLQGHRLKNKSSRMLEAFNVIGGERRILLTGTPIQNSTAELFTLLNFVEPRVFASEAEFAAKFGVLTRSAQVAELQDLIRPFMLRRMKETVETSIPSKEETIIDIELTPMQKIYYRAIYERNIKFLQMGSGGGGASSSSGPNSANTIRLSNVEMQLRKCCNHPFLLDGVEAKEVPPTATRDEQMHALVHACGKMVLLDKLLPKLKQEGHKVLIFSQMVRVLDILEDYCTHKQYRFERLDGGSHGDQRQESIDRFCAKGSEQFVFLLSTRAGGVGLNLTAADTVIIFDSDWNPQVRAISGVDTHTRT